MPLPKIVCQGKKQTVFSQIPVGAMFLHAKRLHIKVAAKSDEVPGGPSFSNAFNLTDNSAVHFGSNFGLTEVEATVTYKE